jgi:hypothetical protein
MEARRLTLDKNTIEYGNKNICCMSVALKDEQMRI